MTHLIMVSTLQPLVYNNAEHSRSLRCFAMIMEKLSTVAVFGTCKEGPGVTAFVVLYLCLEQSWCQSFVSLDKHDRTLVHMSTPYRIVRDGKEHDTTVHGTCPIHVDRRHRLFEWPEQKNQSGIVTQSAAMFIGSPNFPKLQRRGGNGGPKRRLWTRTPIVTM